MKYPLISLFITVLLSACSGSKKMSGVSTGPIDTDDCYPHRRTIQEFTSKDGLIGLVGPNYIITTEDGKGRYQPCTFPEKFKIEGMEIVFTGSQVEILPGERRYANPLRLKTIQKKGE